MWPFQRDPGNFSHDFHNSIPYDYAFQSHLKEPIKADWLLYPYSSLWDVITQCCQSQFHASPWSKIRLRTRKRSFLYSDHTNLNEPAEAESLQSSQYQGVTAEEKPHELRNRPLRTFLRRYFYIYISLSIYIYISAPIKQGAQYSHWGEVLKFT